MTGNKRLEWIDVAKGIGIVLVVMGHTIVPQLKETEIGGFIWNFIYNFHMPLFFFISGWLFERRLEHYTSKGKFISDKLKFLMLPYLTFSIIAYLLVNTAFKITLLSGVLSDGGYTATGLKDALLQIVTYSGHIDKHLWFVYSLFLIFTVNILFPKLMKSKPMLFLLLALYVSKAFVHYYGILDYVASDLFFFSLARFMLARNKKCLLSDAPHLFMTTAAFFVAANCIYSYFCVTQMPSGIAKAVLYLLRCSTSIMGIVTVCTAADFIAKTRLAKPLGALGRYSYDIYLMHAPFLVSGSMGILLLYFPFSLPPAVYCAAVTVAGILLPYGVSRFIIRKIPLMSVAILGKNHRTSASI